MRKTVLEEDEPPPLHWGICPRRGLRRISKTSNVWNSVRGRRERLIVHGIDWYISNKLTASSISSSSVLTVNGQNPFMCLTLKKETWGTLPSCLSMSRVHVLALFAPRGMRVRSRVKSPKDSDKHTTGDIVRKKTQKYHFLARLWIVALNHFPYFSNFFVLKPSPVCSV